MPTSSDKPYRVYRQPRKVRGDGSIPWDTANGKGGGKGGPSGPPREPRNRPLRRLFRYTRRVVYVLVLVAAVWAGIVFLSFRSAVAERNDLVPAKTRDALDATGGPALTSGRNILLIGTDSRKGDTALGRSDSMILMRMDVKTRRYAMLSIPRDLYVPVAGLGNEKINAAYANGGAPLTIKTVRAFTGVDIHHVMIIDFAGFKDLINAVGGIDIDNPRRIRSNKFDGKVWNFRRGRIHLNGKQALAYSRVRKNQLDPGESDLTRGQRQQRVLDAIAGKVVSTESVLHPRDVPHAVVQPLTTDITAGQMLAFGFGKYWAKKEDVLRCRLGGELGFENGQSVIKSSQDNSETINMWLGDSPPVRPNLRGNQFAPGCTRAAPATK